MKVSLPPDQEPSTEEIPDRDPLTRFRSWRGFLVAAIAVNVLFVYGMFAAVSDPGTKTWFKTLSWLPFNVIATVLYYVFLVKLSKADADGAKPTFSVFYAFLCIAMTIANWLAMFTA